MKRFRDRAEEKREARRLCVETVKAQTEERKKLDTAAGRVLGSNHRKWFKQGVDRCFA